MSQTKKAKSQDTFFSDLDDLSEKSDSRPGSLKPSVHNQETQDPTPESRKKLDDDLASIDSLFRQVSDGSHIEVPKNKENDGFATSEMQALDSSKGHLSESVHEDSSTTYSDEEDAPRALNVAILRWLPFFIYTVVLFYVSCLLPHNQHSLQGVANNRGPELFYTEEDLIESLLNFKHMIGYSVGVFLAYLAFTRNRAVRAAALVFGLSILVEVGQMFTDYRTSRLADLFPNFFGIALAFIAVKYFEITSSSR